MLLLVVRRRRKDICQPRLRSLLTSDQILRLGVEYEMSQYIPRSRRVELAEALNLTATKIKIWYANRRAKDRKTEKAHLDKNIGKLTIRVYTLLDYTCFISIYIYIHIC